MNVVYLLDNIPLIYYLLKLRFVLKKGFYVVFKKFHYFGGIKLTINLFLNNKHERTSN